MIASYMDDYPIMRTPSFTDDDDNDDDDRIIHTDAPI